VDNRLVNPSVREALPGSAGGAGLARRIHLPRVIGLGLGVVCVGGGLAQHGAPPWLWLLLAFNGLAWPHIARWWAVRSGSPFESEHRNLLVDSAFGGFWVPAMGFNLLPSALILTMLTMNNLAVGGWRLFARGALAQAAGAAIAWVLLDTRVEPAATLPTILASLPFLVAYPLTIGLVTHRLSMQLSRQKKELARSQHQYRATLDAMEAGIVLYDADDRLVLFSNDVRDLYGEIAPLLKPGERFEDLLRAAVSRGLVAEAAGREEEWIQERLRTHAQPRGAVVHEVPNRRFRRIVEKRLPDGSLLAFSSDVTELVHRQRELDAARSEAEQARQRLEDAINAIPDGFALFDAEDRLVIVNQPYRALYGESAPALRVGESFESILRYGLAHGQYPEAAGREEEWLADRVRQHRHPTGAVIQELPGNRWLRINERPTREGGLAGVRTDVTDLVRREQELRQLNAERDDYAKALQEANARLEQLSETDSLTGLANRRQFDRRLQEEWRRALRHGQPLALLMIDVDYFKPFNDLHGHPQGDACLRKVADTLRSCARRAGDVVARYGGEEFVLLLPHAGIAEAQQVASRCLSAVDEAAIPHGSSPVSGTVTLSIGVGAMQPQAQMEGPVLLLRQADISLYKAKRAGRNRVASVCDA
jgi:diguanylate cyclase (GGDEF)-like protein